MLRRFFLLDRPLLSLLADGEFHSGMEMGESLGLTRAAIWKRLQKLKAQGVLLEQVRGRGYRLLHGIDLLDTTAILSRLSTPLTLELADELASTNDRGLELVREGCINSLVEPVVILAERQTAGRGRLGRHWQSPMGHNLYLTLVWPFAAGVRLQGLSLVVGLVLAEILAGSGLSQVGLKWPNDIHVRRRKLGGILVELAGNLETNPVAVIGIGINGWLGEALTRKLDQPATDWLTETGVPLERNRLAAALIAGLQQALPQFARQGFVAFRERWQGFDLCAGQQLWLINGNDRRAVLAEGVDEEGGLVVMDSGRRKVVHGGEVSIRWQ
jgi:BirA family biotin operon repressor/biotin-[acetyl-CoA-carboxylase] ligase